MRACFLLCIIICVAVFYSRCEVYGFYPIEPTPFDHLKLIIGIDDNPALWSGLIFSKVYRNRNPVPRKVAFAEAAIVWGERKLSVDDFIEVRFTDSLGNEFDPLMKPVGEGTLIWNPAFNVTVPPNDFYVISLAHCSRGGVSIKGLVATFNGVVHVKDRPQFVELVYQSEFTGNFTLLKCIPEAKIRTKGSETVLEFGVLEQEGDYPVTVVFVPFPTNLTDIGIWEVPGALKDVDLTIDVSSVFPNEGWIYVTSHTRYSFPLTLSDYLAHGLFRACYVGYPYQALHTVVEYVKDGFGVCNETDTEPADLSPETRGEFFVDPNHKFISVYPRWKTKGQIEIEIFTSFRVPFREADISKIPFPSFCSYELLYIFEDLAHPSVVVENFTTSCEVVFILPGNTEISHSLCTPVGSFPGEIDGRPTISWVFSGPGEVAFETYSVLFDVTLIIESFELGLGLLILICIVTLITVVFVFAFRERLSDHVRILLAILGLLTIPSAYLSHLFSIRIGLGTWTIFGVFVGQVSVPILIVLILAWQLKHVQVRKAADKKLQELIENMRGVQRQKKRPPGRTLKQAIDRSKQVSILLRYVRGRYYDIWIKRQHPYGSTYESLGRYRTRSEAEQIFQASKRKFLR